MLRDANLPRGWSRKLVQRSGGKTAGKCDVYIFSPDGLKFRSRTELAAYLTKSRSRLQIDDFDFTVTGKNIETHTDAEKKSKDEESLSKRREPRRIPRRSETSNESELRKRGMVKRKRSLSINALQKIVDKNEEKESLNAAKLVVKMDFGLKKLSVPDELTELKPIRGRRRRSAKSPFSERAAPSELLPRKRGRPRKLFNDLMQHDMKKVKTRGRPKKDQEKKKPKRKLCLRTEQYNSTCCHEQKNDKLGHLAPEYHFDENGESAARVRPTNEFILLGKRHRFLHELPDLPPLEEPLASTHFISRPKVEHIPHTWTSIVPQRGSGEYLVLDSGHTYAKMARVTREVLTMTHSRSKDIVVDEVKKTKSTQREFVLSCDGALTFSEISSRQSLLKLTNLRTAPERAEKNPIFYLDTKHGLPLLRGLGSMSNKTLIIKSPQATDITTMPMMSGDAAE